MATILELAQLSDAVYGGLPPMGWTLLKNSEPSGNGYFGQAYRNSAGEIVIANRGTRPTSLNDLLTDFQLGLAIKAGAQQDAVDFARQISRNYTNNGIAPPIIETGHSLGGSHAQVATIALTEAGVSVSAVTFNAPGVGGYEVINDSGSYAVLNLYAQGDAIHLAGGAHLGSSASLSAGPDTVKLLSVARPFALMSGILVPLGMAATALYDILGPAHSVETLVTYFKDTGSDWGNVSWTARFNSPLPESSAQTLNVSFSGNTLMFADTFGDSATFTIGGNNTSSRATATVENGNMVNTVWKNPDGSGGSSTSFADGSGWAELTDVDGSETITGYLAGGVVSSVSVQPGDGDGSVIRTYFFANGAIDAHVVIAGDGSITSTQYFENGAIKSILSVDANGAGHADIYDQGGNITNSTDWTFDSDGRGHGTYGTFGLDILGHETYEGVTADWTVNADGIGQAEFYAQDDGASLGSRRWSGAYDAPTPWPEVTFALGNRRNSNFNRTVVDSVVRPATATFFPNGRLRSLISDDGSSSRSWYANGNPSAITERGQNGATYGTYYYANGTRQRNVISGPPTDISFYAWRSLPSILDTSYRPDGTESSVTLTYSDGTVDSKIVDARGSFTGIVQNPDGTTVTYVGSVLGRGEITSVTHYDANGNITDPVLISANGVIAANVLNVILTGKLDLTVTGNSLDNVITGNAGNDTLQGGTGNDTLISGSGNATLIGGSGATTYVYKGGAGNTTILQSGSADVLLFGPGIRAADITTTVATVSGVTVTTLNVDGHYVKVDGGALTQVHFTDGTDAILPEMVTTMYSATSAVLPSNFTRLTLTGRADIVGIGNSSPHVITGNYGNDTLVAGSGLATLIGGQGNDTFTTFVVNNTDDVIIAPQTFGPRNIVLSSANYVLPANVHDMRGTGSAAIMLTGNGLNNVISANGGNDTLKGLAGDDTLDGGTGVDSMLGGIGNDTYRVDDAGDIVFERSNEGIDTVVSSVDFVLPTNVEYLTLTGSANISATGNNLGDVLTGNAGNSTLVGGTGKDTLIAGTGLATMMGGTGNDTYVVDNADDVVIELLNEGTDTVMASVNYVLPDNIENLTLTGTADLTATGNDLNNVLTGNDGNSTLIAGSGNATLVGGDGLATMIGGLGSNTFVVSNIGDVIVAQASATKNSVQASVDYVIPANVQNLTLTGSDDLTATGSDADEALTGNDGNSTLIAGGGNDTLTAGAGVATLIGGAGNDTYKVNDINDVIIEQAAEGVDVVRASVSYVLAANIENLTLTGSADLTATGNDLDNVITGNAGNHTLISGMGNDTLTAGAGVATLIGGTGNDLYKVNDVGDVIIEQANEGVDTVRASVSYMLAANIENLTLTGNADLTATGNELDNVITGNAGNHTLISGGGNDTLVAGSGLATLIGGMGGTTFKINNVADVVIAQANAAGNTIQSSVSYVLPSNVQNITLTGNADLTATGNNLNNVLTGNGGNSTLIAGTGNCTLVGGSGLATMVGGSGNDTFVVNRAGDVIIETPNSGINTVLASVTYVLPENVQNLFLTGAGNLTATGSGGNNLIMGNSGNNTLVGGTGTAVLQGGAGRDTLRAPNGMGIMLGGEGNDTITGGAAVDFIAGGVGDDTISLGANNSVVAFNTGDGNDTILASPGATGTLSLGGGIAYGNLTFSKSGNNLVLNTGGTDSIILKGWYADSANHDFVTLQILEEASTTYDAASTDPLYNKKIEGFSFTQLVTQFDKARAATPSITSWNLMNGLLNAHLGGSDTLAIGGDLAYYQGTRGNMVGMDLTAAAASLQDPQFGNASQTVHAWTSINQGNNALRA